MTLQRRFPVATVSTTLRRRPAPGATLIEVTIALGLLGSLLISAAGLVTFGNRQIRAGSLRSQALTIARSVMEEMATWSLHQTYDRLGCSADQLQCSVGPGHPAAEPWQALAESRVSGATVEVLVAALDGMPLADSRALRFTFSVAWLEGPRSRTLRLLSLRV